MISFDFSLKLKQKNKDINYVIGDFSNPTQSDKLIKNTNPNIDAPLGFGEVLGTGRVDTDLLQLSYINYLKENDNLVQERFNYDELVVNDGYVAYKDVKAKHIIFCEGFGVVNNPYFNYLPLRVEMERAQQWGAIGAVSTTTG